MHEEVFPLPEFPSVYCNAFDNYARKSDSTTLQTLYNATMNTKINFINTIVGMI